MNNIKNPLIPMGAITGDFNREQIRTMLNRYAEAGITQFLIYPRDGCDVEYMSERWLEICGDIIEYAAMIDMDIWLYDEFNWPSGTCFGKVIENNPEYAAHHVMITDDGYEIRVSEMAHGRIPEQYADILNPDAVDCFINLTHKKYYERFGKWFGTTIKGIFTDEPSVLYYTYNGGYVWFKDAERLYHERTGRELFYDMRMQSPEFYRDYYSLIGDRFAEVYVGRISKWCREHGIMLTGHLMSDDNIDGWVKASGNAIKALRGFGLPGIDDINTLSLENWTLYGYIQSAVRICGNGGLAELFALGPTDIPPARIDQQIWLMSMFGVDHYLLAVAAADARGNVLKNGWYNPMNYANPWFVGYPELGLSASEAAAYARREIDADVCVRVPISEFSYAMNDAIESKRLKFEFSELLRLLTNAQYQWILLDDDEPIPDGLVLLDVSKKAANELFAEFEATNIVNSRVTERDGTLPEHLLVRRYKDGSIVVVDLRDSEESRELTLQTGNGMTEFTLNGRGHWVAGSKPKLEGKLISEPNCEFRLRLDRPNTLRANIRTDAAQFTFNVEERLENIRLLCRNYKSGGSISLDGIELKAYRPVEALTPGFGDLYLSSEEFTLCPGRHCISITEPAKSEPFLPSCFICGSFACDYDDNLRELPCRVRVGLLNREILPQYAGCIIYETQLDIPNERCLIALGSSGLYTRVSLNGLQLGGQYNGYQWRIPEQLLGTTALLKIEQYTTIGPIFGRAADVIAHGDGENWTNIDAWFPKKYERCGVEFVRFVK